MTAPPFTPWEVLGYVATTEGIEREDLQNLTITAVRYRFGRVKRLLQTIKWLSDNCSGYIANGTTSPARQIVLRVAHHTHQEPAK